MNAQDPREERPMTSWSGPLLVLTAAVLWSAAGVGIKSLDLPAMAIVGFRSGFALPVMALLGRSALRISLLRRPAVAVAALAYCLMVCLFVSATRLTTAANAILLQYTAPVWIGLLSYPLLNEKPRRRDWLATALCMAGLAVFFMERLTPEGRTGMILAVLSGVAMALVFIGLRREGMRAEDSAAGVVILAGNALCFLVGLPFMPSALPRMGAHDWGILVPLGIFQLGLPYVLLATGLKSVPAMRATLISLVEPLLNPVWVVMGTGEIPGPGTAAGGLIVLTGIVVDTLVPRAAKAREFPPGPGAVQSPFQEAVIPPEFQYEDPDSADLAHPVDGASPDAGGSVTLRRSDMESPG